MDRPTQWWLSTLRQRKSRMQEEGLALGTKIAWANETERHAAIKFFNAAFRAEESGLRQAHELADQVQTWDPELAELLRLYGEEEGWHRELLTEFLEFIGGDVQPMGTVTRALYRLYGRAERMETIVLANLMFETIGSTTYRMALANVQHPAARRILTILTRDEAFHVPLNVHFLSRVLEQKAQASKLRLKVLHRLLFVSLLLLPLASRPKAFAFDGIGRLELMRGYAKMMAGLFRHRPELGLEAPRALLWLLGIRAADVVTDELISTSIEAAERAANRQDVVVTTLT